jgi:hypothetical protein
MNGKNDDMNGTGEYGISKALVDTLLFRGTFDD